MVTCISYLAFEEGRLSELKYREGSQNSLKCQLIDPGLTCSQLLLPTLFPPAKDPGLNECGHV